MSTNTATATQTIDYDDTPVKWMVYPALIFMVIGMLVGVYISFNGFIIPDYFQGEYFHFGRVRPVHVGHVTLLWLLSVNIGLFYYFVPRLCGVPLWSSKLANFSTILWWPALIIGVYSFPWGTNFGWEYAELPSWVGFVPVKEMFLVAWICVPINLYMTVVTRRYEKMYVSLWYMMGTMVWTSFTVIVGQYIINYVPMGISRVNTNFFYVHNLVGLIFTPMGLAQAYYFLPKLANTPIYSHRLSMIGFWAIAFVYAWIGAHHIIHGPVSQWLQTTAIVFSIWLFIPVFAVVTNIFGTLKDKWSEYQNVGVRFILMGTVFYLLTCIQGPLMALRNINEITSKNDWVIGHSHISLYGTFTFFAIAGIYYVVPAMTRKQMWSKSLCEWHFNLNLLGSVPFILALWIGGFWQGMLWATWADGSTYAEFHNQLVNLPFLATVVEMRPFWLLRSLGGTLIAIANILFLINIFNTVMLKSSEENADIKVAS